MRLLSSWSISSTLGYNQPPVLLRLWRLISQQQASTAHTWQSKLLTLKIPNKILRFHNPSNPLQKIAQKISCKPIHKAPPPPPAAISHATCSVKASHIITYTLSPTRQQSQKIHPVNPGPPTSPKNSVYSSTLAPRTRTLNIKHNSRMQYLRLHLLLLFLDTRHQLVVPLVNMKKRVRQHNIPHIVHAPIVDQLRIQVKKHGHVHLLPRP